MRCDVGSPSLEIPLQRVEQRMRQLVCAGDSRTGGIAAAHLVGGSRVRARLALHAALALGCAHSEATAIAAACELIHNASLVHDDLQDRDVLRRGRATVWFEHGDATAICIGDLLLSGGYAALADCGAQAPRLIAHTHQRIAATVCGQCSDLNLKARPNVPLATYEAVAAGKSGPLLSLPIELALLMTNGDAHLRLATNAAWSFAVAYQMTDDLADVERDALNEELNVVAVLAAAGEEVPIQAASRLALAHFFEAKRAALALPNGIGQLLADYANQGINKLTPTQVLA
jgi:geranylgeranyl diphosphate synthase, type I